MSFDRIPTPQSTECSRGFADQQRRPGRYRTMKLRILVLFGGIPLWGQERANIEVIDALVKEAGAECLFVTHRRWGHLHIQPELARRGLPWTTAPYASRFEKGMPLRRWLANLATTLRASLVLVRILRRFRPTHIHVCNPAYFINFLPVLLATRAPVIYRLGDEPSLQHWARAFLWRRLIAARVAEFVCVSRFVEGRLRDTVGGSIRSTVLYSRPPRRFAPATETEGVRLPKPAGFIFTFAGQLRMHKGIHLFVDAMIEVCSTSEGVGALVAGDFTWRNEFAESLILKVKDRGLEDRIVFLGEIAEIRDLFEQTTVHVCPSVFADPLPNVVLEAKAAGRASIVFPSGGIPELVTHGTDGYICARMTSDALKEACLHYVDDPERARRQGIEARRSLDRLGIGSFGAHWKAVYERNARPRRGARRGRR